MSETISLQSPCPCGSGKPFTSCCKPLLTGAKVASSPEALMRSRYSAFTLADVEYLKKTAKGQALKTFDENGTKAFASKALWLGLSIIKCDDFDGKNIGYVEFIARFIYQGNKEQIHEMSRFEKIQGLWYYTEGKHL